MRSKLTLLALDTATTGCSACVWRAGEVLAVRRREMARGQAEALMPMIHDVLVEAGIAPEGLDGVAVTRGPGAFTGLRIALASARGFALARAIACIGVTTLEAVAHATSPHERSGRLLLACVESKRADLYAQLFDENLHPLTEPLAAQRTALLGLLQGNEALLLVGDATARARAMLADGEFDLRDATASPLPDPAIIAAIAASRWDVNSTTVPEPLYLRPPDAKLPNRPRA